MMRAACSLGKDGFCADAWFGGRGSLGLVDGGGVLLITAETMPFQRLRMTRLARALCGR